MSQLEASIQNARREKRWVEASADLERWLAMSKGIYQAETAELPISVAPSGGMMGKFFGGGKTVRSASFTNEEEELRKLVPKVCTAASAPLAALPLHPKWDQRCVVMCVRPAAQVQKSIDKQSHSSTERVVFLSFVNKHNAHGKVQARMLVVTGTALYNFDHGGAKLKRRISLTSIGSVSANEVSGQFVLHVPSE